MHLPDLSRLTSARFLAAAAATTALAGLAVVAVDAGTSGSQRPAAQTSPLAQSPSPAATTAPAAPASAAPAPSKAKPTRAAKPAPAAKPLYPLPAPAALPKPCPPPPPKGTWSPKPSPPPKVAESALPPVLDVRKGKVDLGPVTGKGMWLTTWADSKVDVDQVVARARAAGLRQLWVRTGGSYQGYYGDRLLAALLPKAHAAGIAVLAWDFPTLSDPVADARRARAALDFRTKDGQRLDGFAPDIETSAEGVYVTERRIEVYLSRVRAYAGDRPVVATVPRPTAYRLKHYPYAVQVPYADVFAPMVYWSCNEPGALATESLRTLRAMLPVHLVGQSYDMGPEGGRQGLPSGQEIWRFLDVGKRGGAIGVSYYLYSQTGPAQWKAIQHYPWR